ncbi:MAG: UDP-N-acetylmuramate--L-alanine ligase [Treponema sp.]|nr:UDP-N-acetylmuramate--L-alanine ligase [Treponema sp.]
MDIDEVFAGILHKAGARVHFVGIKGTGMCALAELMLGAGVIITGSDTAEVFYTDQVLKELEIPYHESFDPAHVGQAEAVIYSAAYSIETNPELIEAFHRGLPVIRFNEALGAYSHFFDSTGITGAHGKTTTTALAGTLLRGVGAKFQVLVGSAVPGFGGRSTLNMGSRFFVAETDEYRRHFLSFNPQRIILSNVEWDHPDYFKSYEDSRQAFLEYGRNLSPNGELIYCHDDPGAKEVALTLGKERPDIKLIPYGFSAPGEFQITSFEVKDERLLFSLKGFPGILKARVPGRHTALNAAAAVALCASIMTKVGDWGEEQWEGLRLALEDFRGSKRRSEILGEAKGILFMDDYGHHPTEIKTTLEGLAAFYPHRRIFLSFMSHTYSRTASLFEDFASSFEHADIVFLHKIYASAREQYQGSVRGESLFERVKELRKEEGRGDDVFFYQEPEEAAEQLKETLREGDLFISMGAGDNWKLSKMLYEHFSGLGGDT